jgi:SAM-dependent methyltransferase
MLESFYDDLAPYYKYLYQDWDASVKHQASVLDDVIREFFGARTHRILDAACGIGTQSIGLAQLGYTITAADISAGEIEKARVEAEKRGLEIAFGIADMRHLGAVYFEKFDLEIACDNAIPHLLSDRDILQAFEQFHSCTTESGSCIISVRDYESMERSGTRFYPRRVQEIPGGKLIIFDVWEFDGDYYDISMYLVEDLGKSTAKTQIIRGGRYYCVSVKALEKLLKEAGFKRVVTIKDRFFQPLLLGIKE